MNNWSVKLTSDAKEDLDDLSNETRKRIIKKLNWFQSNFEEITPLPLSGEWQGFFKLRIGKWRVIYKKNKEKKVIIVFLIGKRDKVYKKQ